MLVAARRRFGFTSEPGILLIAGLMALSVLLFVGGVAVERNVATTASTTCTRHAEGSGETGEGTGSHAGEPCSKAAGSGKSAATASSTAAEHQGERILGVDIENPRVVALIALGWLILAAGLLRFGRRALGIVIAAAAVALIFDAAEVARQIGENRAVVAAVAALVVIGHGAVILLAALALSRRTIPGTALVERILSR